MALPLFGAERTVFHRESRHFSTLAYALGKWLASLPLTALFPLTVLLFWYQLVQPAAAFSDLYVALVAIQFAAEGHGHLISLVANSNMQLVGGVAAMVACVLAGAVPPLRSLPRAFTYFSFASFGRWGTQMLMGLEYYPWLYERAGFPPPPELANSSSGSGGISCFWDPSPDCSLVQEDELLADAIFAALAALNVSLGQLNCTQVVQCPALYAGLTNLTHDIQSLLHDPYELYAKYALNQQLKHMHLGSGLGCECFCGFAGLPANSSHPMPVCDREWFGVVPYCNSSDPFNPMLEGTSELVQHSEAIATCNIFTDNGYELPSGATPLSSRGPIESLVALLGLGLITRVLVYLALVCLDRRKR